MKFYSFEGLDGCGKSTAMTSVAEMLRSDGKEVITTREPGGTPLGEAIRNYLLTYDYFEKNDSFINVNFLDVDIGSFSLVPVPTQPLIKKYIDGRSFKGSPNPENIVL